MLRPLSLMVVSSLVSCGVTEAQLTPQDAAEAVNPSASVSQGLTMAACRTPLAEYDGTWAYSNGGNTGSGYSCAGVGAYGYQYQCVELVMRHFKTKWGLRWYGNAKDLLNNAPRTAVDVYLNGDAAHPPVPGDMIVWTSGTYGHVALVKAVRPGFVDVIEQNVVGNGSASLPYNGASIGPRWSGWVPAGWAHAKQNLQGPTPPPPPPTPGAWQCSDSEYNGAQYWTCSGGDTHRCVNGVPQAGGCPHGCISRPVGTDDLCASPAVSWSCAWSEYHGQWWTCSGGNIYRCENGAPVMVACAGGCTVRALGTNDTCNGGGGGTIDVTWTSPAAGARVDGPVNLEIATSGAPVSRVEVWLNGALAGTDTIAPWSFTLDVSELAGAQELQARAYGPNGESGKASVQVNVGMTVRVLNVIYDPIWEHRGAKLRTLKGWNDPAVLTHDYLAELELASGGVVKYQLVDTLVIDGTNPAYSEYPPQRNGAVFDDFSFEQCVNNNYSSCLGNGADYVRMAQQLRLAERVSGTTAGPQVDEVILWGPPGAGFWESMMMGPGAYWINGTPEPSVPSTRAFAVMGFNYERGVAEAMESFGHRFESTMTRVYAGWQRDQLTAWDRFTALDVDQPGLGGIGNAHLAVNSASNTGYDRDNTRAVLSTADDWYHYPAMCTVSGTCARTLVTNATWRTAFPRGNDGTRSYLVWWLSHVPRYSGRASDGRLNDWWRYFANPDRYKNGY